MNKISTDIVLSDEPETSHFVNARLQAVEITRPMLRYHGGKFLLADWILSNFPDHRCYTETFGGAASVLLKKKRSYAEVYNDLDGEVVNLFRVVRDHGKQLEVALRLTPFARKEFDLSYETCDDPIEQARRTVVRSFMGFGSATASGKKSGFRSNSNNSGTTPARDWMNFPDALAAIIERLRGVVIENRDALEVMIHQDAPTTLHYVDPPYKLSERYNGENTQCYKFEMSDSQHETLLAGLQQLSGMIVLSGYDNDLYNDMLPTWRKVSKKAFADGAMKRIETLWISPNVNVRADLFNGL